MKIFEALRTCYSFLISFFTQDILFYIGIITTLLMVLWSVLSLIFSSERKFSKLCVKNIGFLRKNILNSDNYSTFTALWEEFPLAMRRAWKKYEIKKVGLPSDYLNQSECFEIPVYGGISKQNRSLMKASISLITIVLAFFSISIIGLSQVVESTEVVITSKVFCEALLIPLIFLFVLRINYYIYTLIRQNQYIEARDVFNDLLDTLDEYVDLSTIFFGSEDSVGIVRNVYENQTIEQLKQNEKKLSSRRFIEDDDVLNKNLKVTESGVIGKQKKEHNGNVIESKDIKLFVDLHDESNNKKSDKITSYGEFKKELGEVEELLSKVKTEKDKDNIKKINNQINKKVSRLTAYKNNIKNKME